MTSGITKEGLPESFIKRISPLEILNLGKQSGVFSIVLQVEFDEYPVLILTNTSTALIAGEFRPTRSASDNSLLPIPCTGGSMTLASHWHCSIPSDTGVVA